MRKEGAALAITDWLERFKIKPVKKKLQKPLVYEGI